MSSVSHALSTMHSMVPSLAPGSVSLHHLQLLLQICWQTIDIFFRYINQIVHRLCAPFLTKVHTQISQATLIKLGFERNVLNTKPIATVSSSSNSSSQICVGAILSEPLAPSTSALPRCALWPLD